MIDLLMTIFGVSGVLGIGLGFILIIFDKISKVTFSYMNIYGAVALFTYAFFFEVWLFVVLNIFMFFVGIYGLIEAKKRS